MVIHVRFVEVPFTECYAKIHRVRMSIVDVGKSRLHGSGGRTETCRCIQALALSFSVITLVMANGVRIGQEKLKRQPQIRTILRFSAALLKLRPVHRGHGVARFQGRGVNLSYCRKLRLKWKGLVSRICVLFHFRHRRAEMGREWYLEILWGSKTLEVVCLGGRANVLNVRCCD